MSEPLDPRALEALRGDRKAPAPDEARARVGSRLGVYGPIPAPSPRAASGSAVATGGARALALLAMFVTGAAVGAALHAALVKAPGPRVVYVDRPASILPQAAPEGPRAPSASSPASVASAELAVVPSPNAPASGPQPSAQPAPVAAMPLAGIAQLDAERALLDAARAALVSGDSDTALRALERHTRIYGRPLLGEERDALFVQALVRAGRYDEARARAGAFRRGAPHSLLLPAVDAAISTIP